jgi:CheY-like chemotaxis protein
MAKVIIIDDEFGIAELLQAVLADEGHDVLTASNGKHGLELVEGQTPHIIFLDFMMPVMDGAAVLQRLSKSADLRDIPVVMMSSIPEASVAQRCAGYKMFLRKPFSVFQVIDIVDKLVPHAPAHSD